jgi:hypothetical protein
MSDQSFSIVVKSAFELNEKYKGYKLATGLNNTSFSRHTASMVTENDIADYTSLTVLERVLGLYTPQAVLVNACSVEPTDTLELTVDVATKFEAQEDVPDLVEADLKKMDYTPVSFDLLPNIVHVAVGGKAARQARRNVLVRSIEHGAKALAKSKNSQIKTVLESGTRTGAGGDWTSTDNPYDDIDTAITSIESTYEAGEANTLVAPRPVWTAFWSNAYVKGEAQGVKFPTSKVFPVPGLPGFTGIMDNAITAQSMVVCDRSQYVVLAQGPIEAEGYRSATGNFNAWIIRDWKQPKLAVNDAGYEITAVLS